MWGVTIMKNKLRWVRKDYEADVETPTSHRSVKTQDVLNISKNL